MELRTNQVFPLNWSILLTRPQAAENNDDFDPELHLTGTLADQTEVDFISRLALKYHQDIAQWNFYCPMPGMFSLELEITDEERMLACKKEYEKRLD